MKQADEPGAVWAQMLALPRRSVPEVEIKSIPSAPGVYVWLSAGAPVYAGKASGRGRLRERIGKHLGVGLDLSRSSLRRNVAAQLINVPTSVCRQRPTVMTLEQVATVNAWIRELDVAWLELPGSEEAIVVERELLGEWMPYLSRR